MADGVYKIGQTGQEIGPRIKRLGSYPGDSRVVTVVWYSGTILDAERSILKKFRKLFGSHLRGREYFIGDEKTMINIINNICSDQSTYVMIPNTLDGSNLVECPKCAKVFQHKYQSKAKEKLNAHLSRKNPCDSEMYVIERRPKDASPVFDINDIDPDISIGDDIQFPYVISHLFDIANCKQPFACIPNLDNNQVWYVDGWLRRAPLGSFVDLWFQKVFIAKFIPHLEKNWLRCRDFCDFIGHPEEWKRSELYRRTCEAVRGHLSRPSRSQRIDMRLKLCEFPEGTGELVMEKIIQT
jgi:uncharacterized C2H2 Zn-finger protein